jgi:3-oxoacyl-[acyl-carrier-protein] synthase-3
MSEIRRAAILGTGSYAPTRVRTNEEIAAGCSSNAEWIRDKLGISERRIALDGELTSDMAVEAARKALEAAGLEPDDLDLIIVATATPDRLAPSTACIVQGKLGARNAAAFDVNAVCSGFMFGMATAVNYVVGMGFRRVLVVGADCFSRFTDWTRRDAPFFGDGAGAAVFGPATGDEGFRGFTLGSDGSGRNAFTIAAGGSEHLPEQISGNPELRHFQMDAQDVYRTATRVLPLAIRDVLEKCGLQVTDIDHMVPHQASMNVLRTVAAELSFPLHKLHTNMDRYANTSSATIPLLLDESLRSGRIGKGENVLFAAVGSGWTWGAALYHS